MTSAQVVKTSDNVTTKSPSQDYTHPDDHTSPTYDMTLGFKPFTVSDSKRSLLCNLGVRGWFLKVLSKGKRKPQNFLSLVYEVKCSDLPSVHPYSSTRIAMCPYQDLTFTRT